MRGRTAVALAVVTAAVGFAVGFRLGRHLGYIGGRLDGIVAMARRQAELLHPRPLIDVEVVDGKIVGPITSRWRAGTRPSVGR